MQQEPIAVCPTTSSNAADAAALKLAPRPRRRGVGYVFEDRRSGKVVLSIAFEDVDGRLRRERTNAATKTLARRMLSARQNAVEQARLQGLVSVDALLAPAPALTLRQFSKEYLEHAEAALTNSSYKRAKGILEGCILPSLGGLVLQRVTPGDVQRYSDSRLKAKAAPATVCRELITLSALFTEARKREIVDRNPVSLITKPTVNNTIIRYLDANEERELLARLPEPHHTAVIVAINSGLREGEQINLTWADVRLDERLLIVRNTKSHRDRAVPMNQTLYEALKSIDRHIRSPYVFTNPETGTKFDRFNQKYPWRKALEDAGVRSFRWHDLRHTCASRMVQAGVPLTAVKEILGHASIATTQRYAHLAPANLRDAVRALDGRPEIHEITTHGATQQPIDKRKVGR